MKKLYLGGLMTLSLFSLSGCIEPKLPKCDGKETKELFFKIVNNSLKEVGEREQLVSMRNIEEVAFNKQNQIRVCKADGVYSDAEVEWFSYKIYWGKERSNKKGEKMFYIEITDSGNYE